MPLAKFGGGVAARHLARVLPLLIPGSSPETGAHLTVILSLLNVRSNWSATFLKALKTDCVGCGPRLVSLLTEPALSRDDGEVVWDQSACQSTKVSCARVAADSGYNEVPCLLCANQPFPMSHV
jgi:hypothetical protein